MAKNIYSKQKQKNNSYMSTLRLCSRIIISTKTEGAEPKTKNTSYAIIKRPFYKNMSSHFQISRNTIEFHIMDLIFFKYFDIILNFF